MELTGKREFTVVSVFYLALSAARFTAGLHGITGERTPMCGGAVPVWNMDQSHVARRPFRSRICRLRWYKQSTLALVNRENMMVTLQENVEVVIRQEDETSSEVIEFKLLELQKEHLKLANSKKDHNCVADEIDRLQELKQYALVESDKREGLKQRIRDDTGVYGTAVHRRSRSMMNCWCDG